jgi:hypothetical protein
VSSRSNTVTSAPPPRSWAAAAMPAGPDPTIATRGARPVPFAWVASMGGTGALSAMKRSKAPIATGLAPASDQLQAPSHWTAWSQTREQTSGM